MPSVTVGLSLPSEAWSPSLGCHSVTHASGCTAEGIWHVSHWISSSSFAPLLPCCSLASVRSPAAMALSTVELSK